VPTDPRALARLWFQAHRRFDAAFRAQKGDGPSSTQLELLHLLNREGTLATMDAADRMGLAGATLARAVDAAARRGWVEKMRDPQDRRVVWLRATEAGRAAQEHVDDVLAHLWARFTADLPAADLVSLERVLTRVAAGEGER
jgi:DNA-binding MarR family transcriptional regulator